MMPSQLEDELPAFDLTDKDRENLARTDCDFSPHTWDELKGIIARNELDILRRWPSDLKRYLGWTKKVKDDYGSITDFICQERLLWEPLAKTSPDDGPSFKIRNPTPFADTNDYKILYNDWPYGMEAGITHLVVWVKMKIPSEETIGDLTPESRRLIETFVQRVFVDKVERQSDGSDRVMWFRNWTGLQSVRGMDHIHILVRDVSQDMLDGWTGGRKPLP